jgi:hypothetical protein
VLDRLLECVALRCHVTATIRAQRSRRAIRPTRK